MLQGNIEIKKGIQFEPPFLFFKIFKIVKSKGSRGDKL
jgi:hypothetical protein